MSLGAGGGAGAGAGDSLDNLRVTMQRNQGVPAVNHQTHTGRLCLSSSPLTTLLCALLLCSSPGWQGMEQARGRHGLLLAVPRQKRRQRQGRQVEALD